MNTKEQGFIPSNIPESLELDVMNFLSKNMSYYNADEVYIVYDIAELAGRLIEKYKIRL